MSSVSPAVELKTALGFLAYDMEAKFESADIGLFVGAIATVVVLLSFPAWLGGSLQVAFLAGIALLGLTLGFDLQAVFGGPLSMWLGQMIAGWCLASTVEAAGGLRYLTDLFSSWFGGSKKATTGKFSKWKWGWIFVVGSMAYLVSVLCGSAAAVAFLMYPLAIEVSKDIGLRPSKAVVGVLLGAQLGEIASPNSDLILKWVYPLFELAGDLALETGYPTRLEIELILMPATYVGFLCAATLLIWYGSDLDKSKTFKRRLIAGLATCNYPERYLTDNEIEQMANNLFNTNSKRDGITKTNVAGTPPPPPPPSDKSHKPLHDFSAISVLTDGDYVRTLPNIDGDQHAESVDINRRHDVPGKQKSTGRVAPPPEVANQDASLGPVSRVPRSYRKSNQLISLTIATIGVCWVIIFACLTNNYSKLDDGILDRQPHPAYNVIGTYLFCAGLVLLACGVPVDQVLQQNRYVVSAFVGVINSMIVTALFRILEVQYGSGTDSGLGTIQEAINVNKAVVPFLVAAYALIFNNWTSPVRILFLSMMPKNPILFQGDNGVQDINVTDPAAVGARFFLGFIPSMSIVNLFPWHFLSLYACEIDDTRTTRYGKYLVDSAFFGPVLIAAAAATGVAVGLSFAICNDLDSPIPGIMDTLFL